MDLSLGNAVLGGPVGDGQIESQHPLGFLVEALDIPFLGISLSRDRSLDHGVDGFRAHVGQGFGDVVGLH